MRLEIDRRLLWKRLRHALLAGAVSTLLAYALWVGWVRYLVLSVEPREPERVALARVSGQKEPVRVLFAGDTMLAEESQSVIDRVGHGALLEQLAPIVSAADLAVVNLEAPATGAPLITTPKAYVYRQSPDALRALHDAGFDVVALGNNHTLDAGMQGLFDTLQSARAVGISTIGAGRNEPEARRGLIVELGDLRVGLLSFYKWRLDYDFGLDYYALGSLGGVAELRLSAVGRDVARLRAAGADVVIATPHWGKNYKPISWLQRYQAQRLVGAGVDAVVGHGSHDFQPMGTRAGKPVVFSVGNFAFGTRGRADFRCGLLAQLELDRHGVAAIDLIPIETQNRAVHYRPRLATGKVRSRCLDRLERQSRDEQAELERRGDRARWRR